MGVGPQLTLVGGAVQAAHGLIDQPLLQGIDSLQGRLDDFLDVLDGLQHPFAQVTGAAVPKFQGLVLAGGRP